MSSILIEETETTKQPSRSTIYLWLGFLVVGGFILYRNIMDAGYFGDDFHYYLVDLKLKPFYLFTHYLSSNPTRYRPIDGTFVILSQSLVGLKTYPLHIISLSAHIAIACLVFLFIRKYSTRFIDATLGSFFFLVAQASVSNVASNDMMSQNISVLVGSLSVLTFYLIATSSPKRFLLALGSILFYTIGLFARETAVTYLFMILGISLYNRLSANRQFRSLFKVILDLLPFFIMTVIYLIIRKAVVQPQPIFGNDASQLHFGKNIITNLALYLGSSLLPISSVKMVLLYWSRNWPLMGICFLFTTIWSLTILWGAISSSRPKLMLAIVGLSLLGILPMIILGHIREEYIYNTMPMLAIIVGIGIGSLLFSKKDFGLKQLVVIAVIILALITNIISVEHKVNLLKANGDDTSRWLYQLGNYTKALPPGSKIQLLYSKSPHHYSIYIYNDLTVLPSSSNNGRIINRPDLTYEIIPINNILKTPPQPNVHRFELRGKDLVPVSQ